MSGPGSAQTLPAMPTPDCAGGEMAKGTCIIFDCERARHRGLLCRMHSYRRWRHGSPFIVKKTGRIAGVSPPRTDPRGSYSAVHQRLLIHRGKAAERACPCGQSAEEWAYDHGCPNERIGTVRGRERPYSVDLDHYVAMCRKCHKALDRLAEHAPLPLPFFLASL